MSTSEHTILIKRYAGRRLYNTAAAVYVTLDDIAAMVEQGEAFVVREATTDEDITRSVLAQIASPITEH